MCFNMQLQTERSLDPEIKYVQVRFDDSLYGYVLTLRTNKCSLCSMLCCYAMLLLVSLSIHIIPSKLITQQLCKPQILLELRCVAHCQEQFSCTHTIASPSLVSIK